ncbi:hypothetical protein TNCT_288711 [Trichonephila clavata]|uniref:Uncharacterized protein n=1 Tax=Trichonephila clavata TaxID=2740835 RepID=A0A8X6J226_TRICU|nr:hypothetical protein TNCT_288711 [Trichonephila clavata]
MEQNLFRQDVLSCHNSYIVTEQPIQTNKISVVNSPMIYKICEGLHIKVQLAPMEKNDSWIKEFKRPVKKISTVRSEIVLGRQLDLAEGRNVEIEKELKSSIPI